MYRTLLMDPPWAERMVGRFRSTRHSRADRLPYPTLTLEQIAGIDVPALAEEDAHLWLWTTNSTLSAGYDLMRGWGFRVLAPIVWVKPSGLGAWFVHRTQTILFGYRGKLRMRTRFRPNVLFAPATKHSRKPECSYELIEAVSDAPRLELFARRPRAGWDVWGNEVASSLSIPVPA